MAAFITILTDVMLITIAFVMLIDAIIGEKSLILTKQIMLVNFANVNKTPIENITLARWQCPKGYEPAFNDYFAGYSQGCFDDTTNTFFKGSCAKNGKKQGTDLRAIPKKDIKLWRNKMICLKRAQNLSIYLTPPGTNCSAAFKKCGVGDAWGNYLCIDKDRACPIQYVNFTETKPVINDSLTYYFTIKQERKEKELYMVYSSHPRYSDQLMPLEFTVSEDTPCINMSRFSNTTRTIELNNDNLNYGCIDYRVLTMRMLENYGFEPGNNITLKDRKFRPLDQDTLKNYLDYNDLLIDSQPFFDKIKIIDNTTDINNTIVSLYYRGYIGFNLKCYEGQENIEWIVLLNQSKTYQFLLLILELINLSMLCVFVSLLALMKSESDTLYTIILLFKILVGFTFIYINIRLIGKCYDNSDRIIKYMETNVDNKCFDIDTMYSIEIFELIKLISTCNQYNMFLHYGSLLYGFCFFIQLIRVVYKKFKRYNQRKSHIVGNKDTKEEALAKSSHH